MPSIFAMNFTPSTSRSDVMDYDPCDFESSQPIMQKRRVEQYLKESQPYRKTGC